MPLFAAVFVLLLVVCHHLGQLPLLVLLGYGVISIVTFISYGIDKFAAMNGRQRLPEAHLQLQSLLGGWPGAALAQTLFRHKRQKRAFMGTFLILSMINTGVLIAWLVVKCAEWLS